MSNYVQAVIYARTNFSIGNAMSKAA